MTLFYDLLVKFGPLIKVDDLGFCLIIQAPEFNPKWEAELVNLGYTCHFEQLDDYSAVLVPAKRTITEAAAGPKEESKASAVQETPGRLDLEKIDEADVLVSVMGKIAACEEEINAFKKRIFELEKKEQRLHEPIFACQQDIAKIIQDLEKRNKMGVFP